jgi:LacI family transcriptional regulator
MSSLLSRRKAHRSQRRNAPEILVVVEFYRGFGQQVVDGVASYGRKHGPWQYISDYRWTLAQPGMLDEFPRPDGILAQGINRQALEELRDSGIPTVHLQDIPSPLPRVHPDLPAIGRMAAEYLLELGFEDVAYWGLYGPPHSWTWNNTMREVVEAAGKRFQSGLDMRLRELGGDEMRAWLRELPKPVGLFVGHDRWAQVISRICWEEGLHVPDEVAILGTENDRYVCELTNPPLSSVDQNGRRAGYRAARMLDRLMAGEQPESMEVLIPPRGVIVRQSTNTLATDNRDVVNAMRFIRDHARDGIEVADVLKRVASSRRMLEMNFRKHLNRGIAEEIVHARLEHAKRLLTDTDMGTVEIALACGFSSRTVMSNTFRRVAGMSPSRYRSLRQRPI